MPTRRWKRREVPVMILRRTNAKLEMDSLSCIYFPMPMGFEHKPKWKTHLGIPRKRAHSEAEIPAA